VFIYYPEQSNAADWRPETFQFVAADDGLPVWETVPADLVVTLTIKDGCGNVRVSSKSGDIGSAVLLYPSGYMDLLVDNSTMASFSEGVHNVFLRFERDGWTTQAFIGALPVYEGA
jgi:hypothetical protein